MAKSLTKKEKGFIKDYLITGSGTEAVIKNYNTTNRVVAGVIASQNLSKEKIQIALAERIPDDLLEEKHLALLNKTEKVYVGGEILHEDIDVQAVSKGLEMAYKLKGSYAPEKSQSVNIHINTLDPKTIELAQKYEEELKQTL